MASSGWHGVWPEEASHWGLRQGPFQGEVPVSTHKLGGAKRVGVFRGPERMGNGVEAGGGEWETRLVGKCGVMETGFQIWVLTPHCVTWAVIPHQPSASAYEWGPRHWAREPRGRGPQNTPAATGRWARHGSQAHPHSRIQARSVPPGGEVFSCFTKAVLKNT